MLLSGHTKKCFLASCSKKGSVSSTPSKSDRAVLVEELRLMEEKRLEHKYMVDEEKRTEDMKDLKDMLMEKEGAYSPCTNDFLAVRQGYVESSEAVDIQCRRRSHDRITLEVLQVQKQGCMVIPGQTRSTAFIPHFFPLAKKNFRHFRISPSTPQKRVLGTG